MNEENLTPKQSLELITKVIHKARSRFEENGFIFAFWGALIAVASIGQFVLLKKEYFDISWYPYLLMPIGAVITGIYYGKKNKSTSINQVARMVAMSWNVIAFNLIILGFAFGGQLKQYLIPVILILLAIGIWSSAVALKSRLLYTSGILINIAAFICFYTERLYQPLLMGTVVVIAILLPGIILIIQNKK